MRLAELNGLSPEAARAELMACCGSTAWVESMLELRPFKSFQELVKTAELKWNGLHPNDWREAFTHHPRIGDLSNLRARWTAQEQGGVASASEEVLRGLMQGNIDYEKKFEHVFLVCATGKSAAEMLALLRERMRNECGVEVCVAAAEQAKITRLRLEKLLKEEVSGG